MKPKSPDIADRRHFPPPPVEAITAPLRAIPFLLSRPKLLGLALLPIAINVALFAIVVAAGWSFVPKLKPDEATSAWVAFLGSLAEFAIMAAVLLLATLISALLVIPLAAPFIDLMSEQVENELLRHHPELRAESPTILAGMGHALLEGLRRAAIALPFAVLIFLIGFFPCLGAPTAAALAFLNAALFLPLDAFSYSMDRRRLTLRQKLAWLRSNQSFWLTFGSGLAALLFVPCSLLWFPTLAGVAATRLYCRALIEGTAPVGRRRK